MADLIKWGAGTPGPFVKIRGVDWDIDTGVTNTRYYIGREGRAPIAIIIVTGNFAERDDELDANMRMFCEGPAMVAQLREFQTWMRRADDDGADCEYLNANGWEDVRNISHAVGATLARIDRETAR